jgi:hypothetical protein
MTASHEHTSDPKPHANAQKVSVGRIVLYHTPGGLIRPAIVTEVHSEDCVSLVAFNDPRGAAVPNTSVVKSEKGHEANTWIWPPHA